MRATPEEEDRVAAAALELVRDVREDLAQAKRTVAHASHLELQQLAITLAAMVDVNAKFSVIAWWRTLEQEAA